MVWGQRLLSRLTAAAPVVSFVAGEPSADGE